MSRQTIKDDNKTFVFGHDHAIGWWLDVYNNDDLDYPVFETSEFFNNASFFSIRTILLTYGIEFTKSMKIKHLEETPRQLFVDFHKQVPVHLEKTSNKLFKKQ